MDNNGTPPAGVMDRRPEALGDLRVLSDEILCSILEYLTPRDVARLSCVSSVMYVLCNDEPLWLSLCLQRVHGPLQYRGSWKRTTLQSENVPCEYQELCCRPRHFEGFSSWFLYRRLYRCHTTLNGFNFEDGNVERKNEISVEEFSCNYDGKKPVLLTGLADTWPARQSWTTDQLLRNYGDMIFKISQRSAGKVVMKFKDYVSYMNLQHDEDPLYIFDDKFGEVAPDLLKDYSVPYLFQEDLFDILDRDQRPAFRWFISGPERSGASWHVDPALTSAWNTLLCGRKRWALYPPGRVPAGVTVHVNEDDGDVNIETPSSLQWWLDFYPHLADEDKPIECTQLPGETIFVPSGWWHSVLNLETTVAVTQNFVNSKNFEFVCLDMAPGYRHKGVCRAGLLALDEDSLEDVKEKLSHNKDDLSYSDLTRKEKRVRILKPGEGPKYFDFKDYNFLQKCFSYDINFLSMFLDKERDHYNFPWSLGNSIGQREMREWLYKLWVGKPGMRELIWKGACLALDAGRWLECLVEICTFHKLPSPAEFEKLPVGTGSNPVHLVADSVIKIFVEGGLEPSIYGLGTELEFYSLLHKAKSPLQNHVPEVLASGILYIKNGSYKIVPWDGIGVPDVISGCDFVAENCKLDGFSFGAWRKKQYDYRKAGMSNYKCIISSDPTRIWPYIITKRCRGQIFAQLRDSLSCDDMLSLASFLGEQLCNLHLLPQPPFSASIYSDIEQKLESHLTNGCVDDVPDKSNIPAKWDIFIRTLNKRKKDVSGRLTRWGDPIPETLIEKIDEYIPHDITKLLHVFKTNVVQEENKLMEVCKPFSWIHSDIMEDNIHMEPCDGSSCLNGTREDADLEDNCSMNGSDSTSEGKSWRASHLLDFSDLSLGDPLYDIIPIHLDVFRGDPNLFKQFLGSYKLPLVKSLTQRNYMEGTDKFGRLSYHAMSYCILHEENVLGAIFSIWDELKVAKSWEEVELTVWGELNNYKGIS